MGWLHPWFLLLGLVFLFFFLPMYKVTKIKKLHRIFNLQKAIVLRNYWANLWRASRSLVFVYFFSSQYARCWSFSVRVLIVQKTLSMGIIHFQCISLLLLSLLFNCFLDPFPLNYVWCKSFNVREIPKSSLCTIYVEVVPFEWSRRKILSTDSTICPSERMG